jgi:hypothetical protein
MSEALINVAFIVAGIILANVAIRRSINQDLRNLDAANTVDISQELLAKNPFAREYRLRSH